MRIEFENVRPIWPGYEASLTISYGDAFWVAEQLDTGRLVAQFRQKVMGEVLAIADSDAGTITRPSARALKLVIVGDDTAKMSERAVYFDLIRISGEAKTPIPGRWQWPVRSRVTRDVE